MPDSAAPPAFFYRLSARAQRCYLKSDAIARFELTPSPAALDRAQGLVATLPSGSLKAINRAAQLLVDEICTLLGVVPVRVEIRGVRPRSSRSELHGIFYPREHPPRLIVWMKTAQRHEVVKPRTFVRTLAHELGHYLDYAVLGLGDSFHNRGFFQRESFLVRTLLDSPAPESTARPASPPLARSGLSAGAPPPRSTLAVGAAAKRSDSSAPAPPVQSSFTLEPAPKSGGRTGPASRGRA